MLSHQPDRRHAYKTRTGLWLCLAGLLFLLAGPVKVAGQETSLNHKKIERERARKEKAAQKEYQRALKRHKENQTKETRKRMKQTQKESRKSTPIGR